MLALAIFAGSAAAAKQTPGPDLRVFGLQPLHWGMSADEIRAALPGLTGDGAAMLEKPDYVFSGCHFALRLELARNRLVAITMNSDLANATCDVQIGAVIDAAYGPAYDMQLGTGDALLSWPGATNITFYRTLEDLTHGEITFRQDGK